MHDPLYFGRVLLYCVSKTAKDRPTTKQKKYAFDEIHSIQQPLSQARSTLRHVDQPARALRRQHYPKQRSKL